jgi:hypothetical protein
MRSSLVFNRDIHYTPYRLPWGPKTNPGLRDNECAPDCQESLNGKNIEAMERYTQYVAALSAR